MEVSGQLYALATFSPVPIEYEAGWAPEFFCTLWRNEKSLAHMRNSSIILGRSVSGLVVLVCAVPSWNGVVGMKIGSTVCCPKLG
jgi:hypothetical protein